MQDTKSKLVDILATRLARYGSVLVEDWIRYCEALSLDEGQPQHKVSAGMARSAIRNLVGQGTAKRSGGTLVLA